MWNECKEIRKLLLLSSLILPIYSSIIWGFMVLVSPQKYLGNHCIKWFFKNHILHYFRFCWNLNILNISSRNTYSALFITHSCFLYKINHFHNVNLCRIVMRINKVIITKEFQNSAGIDTSKFSFLFLNSCRSYLVLAFTSSKKSIFY